MIILSDGKVTACNGNKFTGEDVVDVSQDLLDEIESNRNEYRYLLPDTLKGVAEATLRQAEHLKSRIEGLEVISVGVLIDEVEQEYQDNCTNLLTSIATTGVNGKKNFYSTYTKNILSSSIFSIISDGYIPFEYELIDYNDLDISNYPHINNTSYWQAKAIIKSIDDSQSISSNKFLFIDYDLNHTEFSFDMMGNRLSEKESANLNNLVGNYIYSSVLLVDMVNYIKDIDENAVIILQGDHGLHTGDNEILMKTSNKTLYIKH